jgi:hypothetical protein
MRPLIAFLALGTLTPAVALAHSKLYQPTPVNDNDANKTTTAPCGTIPAMPVVTQFTPGGDLQVSWYETVNHVGWFELRFAQNGPGDCTLTNTGSNTDPTSTATEDPIHRVCPTTLTAPIMDPNDVGINEADPKTWKKYTQTVKMPNVSCTDCILQLVQWMGSGTPTTYTPYYSCARITTGAPSGPADMAGTASSSDMAGGGAAGGAVADMGAGGGVGVDMAAGGQYKPSGGLPGCSMGGAAAPSGALPLLGLLLLVAVDRLRRRARCL